MSVCYIIYFLFAMANFAFAVGEPCAFPSDCVNGLTCTPGADCTAANPIGPNNPCGTCQAATPTTVSPVSPTATSTAPVPMLTNPLNETSVPKIVGRIINYLLGFTGTAALAVFIYGGILIMTSAGDAKRVSMGKDAMVWAVVGLAIIFASYALLDFVIAALTGGATAGSTATTTPPVVPPANP